MSGRLAFFSFLIYAVLLSSFTTFGETSKLKVSLKLEASPIGSGTIEATGIDDGQVVLGDEVILTATANKNYNFIRWSVDGVANLTDSAAYQTNAYLYGNSTITAIFEKQLIMTTVTMATNPSTIGQTDPTSGTHTLPTGDLSISATPTEDYLFVSWDISGDGYVSDPFSAQTTLSYSAEVTATANFARNVSAAMLTIRVSPKGKGTTNPAIGVHGYQANEQVAITATAATGYLFHYWSVEGKAELADIWSSSTTVKMTEDAIITANFVTVTNTTTLTMAAAPSEGGTINPVVGEHIVQTKLPTTIEATPGADYLFSHWSVSGNARLAKPLSQKTKVTPSGLATVTANFAKTSGTAKVTMAVSPTGGGTTTPATGTHTLNINVPNSITASPIDGYFFDSWSVTGLATIIEPLAKEAYLIVSGEATVTAKFEKIAHTTTFTMAVSPEASGSVNPGAGEHTAPVGDRIEIEATPASGYYFVTWSVSGQGELSNPQYSKTSVEINGTATVTANFEKIASVATLNMAIAPESSGSVNPGIGEHVYPIGEPINVTAWAATDYIFLNWQISGNGSIDSPENDSAIIILSGDAKLTARFAKATSSAKLTLAVSPENSGSTNPGIGEHTFATGQPIAITANPSSDYIFYNWTTTGQATITNINSDSTIVLLSGNGTVTANFVKFADTATLTMAVTPESSGFVNPGVGAHTIPKGGRTTVKATAADGYYFTTWSVSGQASLDSVNLRETTVKFDGNATVTANFEKTVDTATLTMAITPESSGSTNPGVGNHVYPIGEPIYVTATPAENYIFTEWTLGGEGSLQDPTQNGTILTLGGDATLTANFSSYVDTTTLTLAISPVNSGSTNPGIGEHVVIPGEPIKIQATSASGYIFSQWSVSGQADIADANSESTTIALTGATTVTANFVNFTNTATLSMEVGNEGGGSTSPGVGSHTVPVDMPLTIVAVPKSGYFFNSWSFTGDAEIEDPLSSETTIRLSGDATVTAAFISWVGEAEMTMEVSETNQGTTNPGIGTHYVPTGSTNTVEATESEGYVFVKWTVEGEGAIRDRYSPKTVVEVSGDVVVTAEFATVTETATLTLAVSPTEGGETNPSVGAHTVAVGGSNVVEAIAASGYMFDRWLITDSVKIDNAFAAETTVWLEGDGTVTASFVEETDTVTLTMAVSPEEEGTTSPAIGEHSVNILSPIEISALPTTGYNFAGWTISGNGVIIDATSSLTSVILNGDSTVTANFQVNEVEFMAVGSVTNVAASEIGGDLVDEFTKKPKFWVEYNDPTKDSKTKRSNFKTLTKVSKKQTAESVDLEWTSRIKLYNQSDYKSKESSLSELLAQKQIANLITNSFVMKCADFGKQDLVVPNRTIGLANPSITLVRNIPEKAGDTFTLEGMFFGSKPPNVLVEFEKSKKGGTKSYHYLKCGIVKEDTLIYRDAQGKENASCMKVYIDDLLSNDSLGFSSVVATYPKVPKGATATGYVIVDNGIGMAAYLLAIPSSTN